MTRILLMLGMLVGSASADDFIITERFGIVVTERLSPVASDTNTEYYVATFTASWCNPCRAYRLSGVPAKITKRFPRSVTIDIDSHPQYRQSIPAVWLIRTSDRKVIRKWVGATSLESIEAEVRLIAPNQVAAPKPIQMTHEEMVRLHNQLHGGGAWTWPGDLADHLESVHGVHVK